MFPSYRNQQNMIVLGFINNLSIDPSHNLMVRLCTLVTCLQHSIFTSHHIPSYTMYNEPVEKIIQLFNVYSDGIERRKKIWIKLSRKDSTT